jgi:hypothetical protein
MKIISLLISVLLLFNTALSQSSSCSDSIKEDSVQFSKKSVFLNKAAKKKLDSMAIILNLNPGCRIAVTGYDNSCLTCQQTSWNRVYSVIKHLRQTGVDSLRFVFSYSQEGKSPWIVTIRSLLPGEDGPSMEAPPSPCYSYYGIRHKRCKGKL